MSIKARLLQQGDEGILDAFLKPHTPYVFYMRVNLKSGGISFDGKPNQADYFGAFEGDRLVGVLTHNWMGSVQVYSEDKAAIPLLASALRKHRQIYPRSIDYFLGHPADIRALLFACHIGEASLRKGGLECNLYSCALNDIKGPDVLNRQDIGFRPASAADFALLAQWRHDFDVEENKASDGAATLEKAKKNIQGRMENNELYILEDKGEGVSFCGAISALSDWGDLGPVWTPPEFRRRGYGKAVSAGAMLTLRDKGLTNAMLFSSNPHAEKIYRDLSFRPIGKLFFDFLKEPVLKL